MERGGMGETSGCVIHKHDLHTVDLLRLVASLGVVAYHYLDYLSPAIWPGSILAEVLPFRLWVDLFFVLSGFVIAHVYAAQIGQGFRYRNFLKKRVARLFPLHVVTLLFYVLVGISTLFGVKADSASRFDWSCLIPNLLLFHATGICKAVSFNTPSWSISAEMGMYILFPLFALAGRAWRAIPLLVGVVAVIVALEWLSTLPNQQYWLFRASQGGVLRAFPSFMLGVVLFYNRDLLARIPLPLPLAMASLTAFIVLAFSQTPYFLLFLLVYLTVIAVIATDVQGKAGAIVARLGKGGQLTYSIYLLHLPVATVMMTFAKRVLHLKGLPLNLWVLLTLAVMLAASILSYRYFEMPARRWISALGSHPAPRKSVA